MLSMNELRAFLKRNNCDFEILAHEKPIVSTLDAARYFDMEKAAPTFIMETEQGLVAIIVSFKRRRMDFKAMKRALGFSKLKMADSGKVLEITGAIPLIGHDLPCVFDDWLLAFDYIYGGTGDALHTLKIKPTDVASPNNVVKHILKVCP